MLDIDPQLLRLREIEARIAFAEFYIGDQRALVNNATRLGFVNGSAHSLLRTMEDSLVILKLRRDDMLGTTSATPPPGH